MATVVLTAVGAVFGGPVGAAIGAAAGIVIDSELADKGVREGPRLGDLRVQTSRYGSAIPKLFGRTRVSGTVIWSTDLIETRGLQSNGKGRGATANYSYAASFAVLLSARQVLRVERIWADGNLLRGSAGDFKTATGFRLLTGDADQPLDPLIAAAEGLTTTPAYRGRTVAVFEDFQLAAYGNRVPSLSFEVVADEGPVSAPAIVAVLTGGAVSGSGDAAITGMAAAGDSVRSVATALDAVFPWSLHDDGAKLVAVDDTGPVRTISADDLGAGGVKASETRAAALRIAEALALNYNDPARDYQPGVQRARRDGGARREETIALGAVFDAATAKALVEARLGDLWRERRQIVVTLPWRAIDLRPGDRVTLPGDGGVWRIAALAFERMIVRLTLIPVRGGVAPGLPADAGRSLTQPDRVHGATTLVLLDLPGTGERAEAAARVAVAANGASPGWQGASLLASADGGAHFAPIGATAVPAIMGSTLGTLGPGDAALIDRVNHVDVTLLNAALALADADAAALAGGANLAMIGGEALQFGRAEPLGAGRWRLSELWRGRGATEARTSGHGAGEPFVLLESRALAPVPAAYAIAGLRVRATGIGDGPEGTEATLARAGLAATPLSPVHLRATPRDDGGFDLAWVRRSREGGQWRDTIDVPLGEEREAYRVERRGAGLAALTIEVDRAAWVYSAAQVAADRSAGATAATIAVAQIGSLGVSVPATTTVSL